jgi:serine/threonine-protein kinase HipA
VFIVAIGNGDAHIKNWSLIYRDGVRAELAPAYDLVSTIHYISGDGLGLNLAKSKLFTAVSMDTFSRFAEKVGTTKELVEHEVDASVLNIREAWLNLRDSLPLPPAYVRKLEEHWKSVPLFGQSAGV